MVRFPRQFVFRDTIQQVVGGFLIAGPFVVTEEVWILANSMTFIHAIVTFCLVLGIGYGALYKADNRDPETERSFLGIPLRFISLVGVAHIPVLILATVFGVPTTFFPEYSLQMLFFVTLKTASIASVFTITGAAAADTLFSK